MKIFSAILVCLAISMTVVAQETKSETLKVPGVCGMCKKKIEKAATEAGASYAIWDKQTKVLTVSYNSSSSNTAKIEKKIAEAGYDTPDFKATDAAYNDLDECCQYERAAMKLSPVAAGLRAELTKTASAKSIKTIAGCSSDKTACNGEEKACCKGDQKSCCSGAAKETSKPAQQ
ncbi:MAG TPA: hypothetical protein VLJ68_11245 [Chitinophagaceae bacterium]|nr:hypothetical protein [Chitinophagaceae bacterium]